MALMKVGFWRILFISLVLFLHRLPDKLNHNQKFNTKISLNDQIGIDLFTSLFLFQYFFTLLLFHSSFMVAIWSKATYFETRLAFLVNCISSPVLLSLSLIEGIYYTSWSGILNFYLLFSIHGHINFMCSP